MSTRKDAIRTVKAINRVLASSGKGLSVDIDGNTVSLVNDNGKRVTLFTHKDIAIVDAWLAGSEEFVRLLCK